MRNPHQRAEGSTKQPTRHSTSFGEEELHAFVALMTSLRMGKDVRVLLRNRDLHALEMKLRNGLKNIQARKVQAPSE